jgi:hypothetical protein
MPNRQYPAGLPTIQAKGFPAQLGPHAALLMIDRCANLFDAK